MIVVIAIAIAATTWGSQTLLEILNKEKLTITSKTYRQAYLIYKRESRNHQKMPLFKKIDSESSARNAYISPNVLLELSRIDTNNRERGVILVPWMNRSTINHTFSICTAWGSTEKDNVRYCIFNANT